MVSLSPMVGRNQPKSMVMGAAPVVCNGCCDEYRQERAGVQSARARAARDLTPGLRPPPLQSLERGIDSDLLDHVWRLGTTCEARALRLVLWNRRQVAEKAKHELNLTWTIARYTQ